MNKAWIALIIPGVIAIILSVFVLALLLIKLVWPWTIPDLFPGAVDQGLIAREITWYTSFKLAIFVAVLAGISGIFHGKESRN
ncbi:MAG: hypothetical protein JRF60_14260 [Deltaproteobacteria bacterium]|jgi:hypothetical protein|nr:hypothetical protein [Deltaproteobacteria bacterium]